MRVGSTFKGFDTDPIRYQPWALRLQRATLTYANPVRAVVRRATSRFAPALAHHEHLSPYLSLHLRGGDGEFKRRFAQTIRNAFKECVASYLTARRKNRKTKLALPVALYIASDTTRGARVRGRSSGGPRRLAAASPLSAEY